METTVDSGMCRCCASEGLFKDVNTTYHWMGEDEVYADMLHFCFDITLASAEGQNNGGICEVCITQLRNAANFKKQVQHTEEQFKKRLAQVNSYKPEVIKVEMSVEDGAESDNNLSEDYQSGPEFEVPIKEESPEPKPKKRAAKATTSKAKKVKTDSGETSTKRVLRTVSTKIGNQCENELVVKEKSKKVNVSKVKMDKNDRYKGRELEKHRTNIREILQCSNATPIRCHGGIGYACCFCAEQYPDPMDLKKHTLEEHDAKAKRKFMEGKMMFSYLVKLDITSLKCTLCDTDIPSLEQIIEHLITVHERKFYSDIKNHIVPFKFDGDTLLKCVYCLNSFNKFKALQEHMNIHYRNYICEVCDAGFVNRNILLNHAEGHKKGTFKCDFCEKVFDTYRKKKSHEKSVHIHLNMLNRCGYCNEKFKDYRKKLDHLARVHGVRSVTLKCKACDKTFETQSALTIHIKRDHLLERRHECKFCDMKFFVTHELKEHMVKHTGVRNFECEVCHKAYARRKTLREHMRIHADDRRFKCDRCGQAFVQKCSWRGHMRAKHGQQV